MNPPIEDLKDMIVAAPSIVDLTFGTDLFLSKMPSTPDKCVALFDTGGLAPYLIGVVLDRPTVQVKIRGKQGGYKDAYTVGESIKDFFEEQHDTIINGTRYLQIYPMQDVVFLNYDELDRPLFTINFRMDRTA